MRTRNLLVDGLKVAVNSILFSLLSKIPSSNETLFPEIVEPEFLVNEPEKFGIVLPTINFEPDFNFMPED